MDVRSLSSDAGGGGPSSNPTVRMPHAAQVRQNALIVHALLDDRSSPLSLHEQVALLALRNDSGTVPGHVMYAQAAGAALLAELLLRNRLRAVDNPRGGKAPRLVEVADAKPTGDELLDECVRKVAEAKRRSSLPTWVQTFAGLKKLHARIAERLVKKGVLKAEEVSFLGVFKWKVYPEFDPSWERETLARLGRAIDSDAPLDDARTAVLLAIAHPAGLLVKHFDKPKLKARKARIEAIARGEAVGQATAEAVQAVQVAMIMAAILPAVVATTISASH
jgi:Golgi phosphoprotein 3